MFIRKKKLQEILKRIESLEDSEQKVITAEQGKQTLSYYIRLFSSYIGKDRSQELRSFGKKEQAWHKKKEFQTWKKECLP